MQRNTICLSGYLYISIITQCALKKNWDPCGDKREELTHWLRPWQERLKAGGGVGNEDSVG